MTLKSLDISKVSISHDQSDRSGTIFQLKENPFPIRIRSAGATGDGRELLQADPAWADVGGPIVWNPDKSHTLPVWSQHKIQAWNVPELNPSPFPEAKMLWNKVFTSVDVEILFSNFAMVYFITLTGGAGDDGDEYSYFFIRDDIYPGIRSVTGYFNQNSAPPMMEYFEINIPISHNKFHLELRAFLDNSLNWYWHIKAIDMTDGSVLIDRIKGTAGHTYPVFGPKNNAVDTVFEVGAWGSAIVRNIYIGNDWF